MESAPARKRSSSENHTSSRHSNSNGSSSSSEGSVVMEPPNKRVVRRRRMHYLSVVLLGTSSVIFITLGVPLGIRHFGGCFNPKCGNFFTDVAASVNPKQDPCDDFYNYVCSKFVGPNQFIKLQIPIALQTLKSLLLYDTSQKQSSITTKAANLFLQCAQGAFMGLDNMDAIRAFMDQYRLSWPPATHAPPRDVLNVLVHLCIVYGIPVLFDLGPATYFKNRTTYNMHIKPSLFLLEWSALRSNLRTLGILGVFYIRTALIMSKTVPQQELIERLVQIDNGIFTAMGVNSGDRPLEGDMLTHVPFSEVDNFTGISQDETPLNLLETINQHLPKSKRLEPNEDLTIWTPLATRYILRLIALYRQSVTLHAYISLTLLRQLGATSSHRLSEALFPDDSSSTLHTMVYMIGKCFIEIWLELPYVFGGLFVRRWLTQRDIDAAKTMTDAVRNATEAGFHTLSWMDNTTREHAIKRMQTLRSVVGFPENLLTEDKLDAHYAHVPELEGTYLDKMSTLRKSRHTATLKFFKSPAPDDFSYLAAFPMVFVNAAYFPVYHYMIIPAAIIFSPFFSTDDTEAVYYGSLGHVIGHEITHAFDPEHGLYDEEGIKNNWWTNVSRVNFEERVQCLRDLYNAEGAEDGVRYGDEALSENFADCGGMDKAYRAHKKVGTQDKKTVEIGGTTFTHDQLFFLSSCFKWCGSKLPGEKQVSFYSPMKLRCNVPLMNMRQFGEAFKCPANSRMNPQKRCDLL
ncbi:neprilysin-like [Ornithodoros turicata]|uniref:neprilysin-like n=1 Tax=Ornithodoros turicata TaxID=34597 RepID=UPI003139A512